MPKMDGVTAVQELRKQNINIPIVGITGIKYFSFRIHQFIFR